MHKSRQKTINTLYAWSTRLDLPKSKIPVTNCSYLLLSFRLLKIKKLWTTLAGICSVVAIHTNCFGLSLVTHGAAEFSLPS